MQIELGLAVGLQQERGLQKLVFVSLPKKEVPKGTHIQDGKGQVFVFFLMCGVFKIDFIHC